MHTFSTASGNDFMPESGHEGLFGKNREGRSLTSGDGKI